MLLTWPYTSPSSIWTPQEPTPGSCLWTSALHLTPSSQLGYRTNSPSSTCLTPPAGGSQTSCLTGNSTWSWGKMSLTPRQSAKQWWWLWTLERTQPHLRPSSCVTPQLTLWSPSASWVPSSPRTSSGSCQRRWWCTSTPPSLSPSSPYPSPSGTLLPLPRTRADCSVSFVPQRRRSAATCHPSRTCTSLGPWGVQARLWLTPPTPATNSLNPSPLAGGYMVHQLASLTRPESRTDTESYTHPTCMHYINALPSSVQFSYLLSSLFLSMFLKKVFYSCVIFVQLYIFVWFIYLSFYFLRDCIFKPHCIKTNSSFV